MAHALRRVGPGDPGQRPDGRARDAGAAGRRARARSSSLGPVAAIGVACVLLAGAHAAAGDARRSAGGAASGRARQIVAYDPERAVTERAGRLAALRRPRAAAAGPRARRRPSRCSRSARSACSPTRRTTASTSFFKKHDRERRRLQGARAGASRRARSRRRRARRARGRPGRGRRRRGRAAALAASRARRRRR